jgi:hypothetical protein
MLVLTHGQVLPEFAPHLDTFDRVEVTEAPYPPGKLRQIPGMILLIRRFRRGVRSLGLGPVDIAVGYSFRALVLTAFIRALDPRPQLVRIRQCNHELEHALTRRRPLVSAYWNLWNRFAGVGAMRYRWLPSSRRHGAGTFLADPYDDEFCLTTPDRADAARGRLAWPFPVLRPEAREQSTPTLVFLGEIYPVVVGESIEQSRSTVQAALDRIRELHPSYRLVFKPRSGVADLGLDLTGWELGPIDRVLESLLMEDPSIRKVVSFRSSGSTIASQYGCSGYLLYPSLELPADFRAFLDEYFEDYRGLVTFSDRADDVAIDHDGPAAEDISRSAAPLIDLLAGA